MLSHSAKLRPLQKREVRSLLETLRVENRDRFEKRQRKLPASLVVCLVIAMRLWSSDSMGTVLNRQWMGQY